MAESYRRSLHANSGPNRAFRQNCRTPPKTAIQRHSWSAGLRHPTPTWLRRANQSVGRARPRASKAQVPTRKTAVGGGRQAEPKTQGRGRPEQESAEPARQSVGRARPRASNAPAPTPEPAVGGGRQAEPKTQGRGRPEQENAEPARQSVGRARPRASKAPVPTPETAAETSPVKPPAIEAWGKPLPSAGGRPAPHATDSTIARPRFAPFSGCPNHRLQHPQLHKPRAAQERVAPLPSEQGPPRPHTGVEQKKTPNPERRIRPGLGSTDDSISLLVR